MCSRSFEKLWVLSSLILLLFPAEACPHIFRLYSGTDEETKERITINFSPDLFTVEYSGEYHGQLAAHIRFMMDMDQDNKISEDEERKFISDYQQMWCSKTRNQKIFIDDAGFNLAFKECTYPGLGKSNLADPLTVVMRFQINAFQVAQSNKNKDLILEIRQRMLFQFAQQFIEMSKNRAAFTQEQENAIARFFQVKINATDNIRFTRCHPGYLNRLKNSISGIFFDETITRIQFLPYPKISASFKIDGK